MNFSSFLGFLCRHKTAEAVLILLQLFLPLGLLAFLRLEQESVSVSLEPESSSLELAWVSGEWSCSSLPFGSTVYPEIPELLCPLLCPSPGRAVNLQPEAVQWLEKIGQDGQRLLPGMLYHMKRGLACFSTTEHRLDSGSQKGCTKGLL